MNKSYEKLVDIHENHKLGILIAQLTSDSSVVKVHKGRNRETPGKILSSKNEIGRNI